MLECSLAHIIFVNTDFSLCIDCDWLNRADIIQRIIDDLMNGIP